MGIRNRFANMIKYLKDKYYWWNVHNKLKNFLASFNDDKIVTMYYTSLAVLSIYILYLFIIKNK